jgi:transcriptional regulator with XRE-family HTH domain
MATTLLQDNILSLKEVNFVYNIKRLMAEKTMNEATLAKKTAIPQPTLHKILSGKTADPRVSTLKLIAEHFNVSLDTIMYTGTEEKIAAESLAKKKTKAIPVISWQECVEAEALLATLTHTTWKDWRLSTVKADKVVCLIAKSSMEAQFSKGALLSVALDVKPVDGDWVVVHYPHSEEATIRQLVLDGPLKRLKSIHNDADILDESIRLIGVVVEENRVFYQG